MHSQYGDMRQAHKFGLSREQNKGQGQGQGQGQEQDKTRNRLVSITKIYLNKPRLISLPHLLLHHIITHHQVFESHQNQSQNKFIIKSPVPSTPDLQIFIRVHPRTRYFIAVRVRFRTISQNSHFVAFLQKFHQQLSSDIISRGEDRQRRGEAGGKAKIDSFQIQKPQNFHQQYYIRIQYKIQSIQSDSASTTFPRLSKTLLIIRNQKMLKYSQNTLKIHIYSKISSTTIPRHLRKSQEQG